MSRLDEFKESAQKRRENLGLDYKSSKETYSKPKNKLESFKNNAQKRREEVNKDILSPKRVATAYNPEDRDTVRNWIDRYNKVVKGISDYNAKRNGAYTLDASGGYAEDLEALIADFAEIKQYSRRYGVANPHMYLKQLEDLRDSISSINSEMAKFSTEDEYNKAWKAAQEYEQQKVLDITAAEKEIADLQAAREYYARNHEFDWMSAAERDAHDRYLQEQDELIAQKKRFVNRAKNIQEGIRLSGAAENADFDNYNGYVSTYSDNVFSGFDGFNTAGYRDLTYEYINNQDGAREAIMQMDESQSLINVEGGTRALKEKGYEFMTEDEVGIYNYYYAKEGKEKAQTYLDNIQETLNQRKATSLFGKMEDKTALELAFGIAAGIDQFQTGMENVFNDEEYIPASAYQIASQMVRQDLGDVGKKLPDWMGGASLGQVVYDTVTTTANMAPSMILSIGLGMVNPVAGQVAGTALMGASAMGNAYQEALNLGYDKGQARMYSALVGSSEAGLQYLLGGIGKLGGILPEGATAQILSGIDNAFARTAIKIGGNMLSEGFEEGLQEILTPWFQNLALHAGEDINWSEVAYASLLGMLTANAMEGGSTIGGEVQNYRIGSQLEASGVTAQQLADIGTTFSADTVAYKLAERISKKTQKGNDIGAYTIGRMFHEIDANLTEQNVNDIASYLKAKGMPENVAKANARAMERVVAGEKLTQRQITAIEGNEILAEAMRTTIIYPNATWYQRTNRYNEVLRQRQEYQNASRMNPDAQTAENTTSGNAVDTENKEGAQSGSEASEERTEPYSVKRIASIKDGKATVVLEDDTESNVSDAYISSDDGVRIETIASIDGISTQDANFILSTLKVNPGANAQVDSLGAKEAYKYGYFGFSKEHLTKHGVFANALTESQRDAIYAAGQEARQQQDNAATPKKAGSSGKITGVYFDAGKGKVTAYRESDQKTLTDKQKAGVQAAMVLQKLGIGGDIYFFESYRNSEGKLVYTDNKGKERPAPNGWYEKDGSIHIDLNAGTNGNGFVLFTLAHELTHFIEQWSPKKYRALAEFLTREYEKGESMDKRVRAKQLALYESRGKSVSYGEAYSEVVADSMEAMLADGNVLDKLSKLKAQDKTIFDKMKEFFDNLAAKIRSIYKGMTPDSAEGRAVMEMKDAIEELQQLFTEGLAEASKNFQGSYASEKAEKLAAQSREEVRYSMRDLDIERVFIDYADTQSENKAINSVTADLVSREKVVKIRSTDVGKYASSGNSDDKKAARSFLKTVLKQFMGESVYFNHKGNYAEAYLTSGGIDHSVGGIITSERTAIFNQFYELVKKAEYAFSSKNDIHSKVNQRVGGKIDWDCFVAVALIEEKPYPVVFKIRTIDTDVRSQIYEMATKKETNGSHDPGQLDELDGMSTYGEVPLISGDKLTHRNNDVKQETAYEIRRNSPKTEAEISEEKVLQADRDLEENVKYSDRVSGQKTILEDKYYARKIDQWDGKDHGSSFRVGKVSEPLLKIGIPDVDIWFDQSKAAKQLDVKEEVTKEVIKKIPYLLEHPIAVSESYDNTVMVFGEMYDQNGKPIVVALRVNSTNRRNHITLVNKIRSVGTRTHNLDKLLSDDSILYLSETKKETNRWFNALGRSTPFGGTKFGLIRSISFDIEKSNIISSESAHKSEIHLQDRPSESVSNRSLLADAFEGIAKTELEKKKVQEYRGKIQKSLPKTEAEIDEAEIMQADRDLEEGIKYSDRDTKSEKYSEPAFNEWDVQAALYDAMDHADNGYDNMIRVGNMPIYISEKIGIEGDFYIYRNHAYENMVSREQAIKEGRPVTRKGEKIHFHNLGVDTMTEAIMSLENPIMTIATKTAEGNPAVIMLLPVMGKNKAPLYAVLSFYSKRHINGDLSKRPHVVLTIAEREFFGSNGRSGYAEIVKNAVNDGRVIDFNKKMRDNLSVIANPAGVGNITDSSLKKNLSQFTKEIKRFREENEIQYQDRPAESVSNRSLLANALEGVAQNDIERKRLAEYRAKIQQVEAEEENLQAIREKIREEISTEEPDYKVIRKLQIAAIQSVNRINIYDNQLLRLEATKPLQNVISMEKKKSYDSAALKGEVELEIYRQRAERKQAETVKRYQNARDRGIENRQKTALRQKIRKVIRDLDKILNRGNKKRNVKEDIKDFVAEALHSAEVLFMDTYTNEDMVFYGVQTDLTPEEAKFMEEAKGILEELRNMPTGYEGWEARQEKEAKLKSRLAYRMGKLKDVFVRERTRLNRTQVSEVLENLADAYKNLESSEHLYVKDAFHENVYQYLLQLKEDVGGTIVRDMSIQQLEELYKGYQMVMTTVQNANRIFAENLNMTRDALANRVMTEVKTAGGQHGLWTKAGEKVNQFLWNNQKAVYAFEWIGSETLKKLYGNIRKGQDVWAVDMQEANAFRQEMYRKYNRSKWNFDKQYKFKSSFDEEFTLNLEQIMSLYAYSRREQAHEHLLKGGFVFDGSTEEIVTKGKFKRKYLKKDATAYNLSMGVYEQIISTLTAEQKAFVEDMQGYLSDTMGNKGNDVSMQLYGVKLFNEKFYFPLRSAGQYMERAKEADLKKEQGQINLVNSGFAKATKIRASNPVVLSGFMDVWADHVNEMSMYHSFVLPMEDFRRVYNYSSPHLEESASSSVNQVIENAYGSAATAYIDQLYRDLNGGAIVDSRENLFKNMVGKFKKAAVFASASVTIQQPSAIGRAFAYIDPKYFVGAKVDAKRHKVLWEEVKKYAPVAFIKEMGYFDTGMGQSAKDYLTSEEHTGIKDKVKAMFSDEGFRDEALGKLPGLADEITWCAIWEAVKRETRAKHPGMNVKSDAFLQIAGDRFSEVIDKTQVYDSVLARSANMRSKGTFMAIATSFMAEPTTSINMLEDALRKYRKGGNANKKHAKAVIASVFTSVLLNSILVSFVYAARDDDEDETYLEKYTSSFVTEMLDGVNPVTYYPFLKDIWSSLQGYDIERADMSLITALVDASQKVFDVMTKDTYGMTEEEYNEHQKDIVAAMWGVVDSISSLMGIPLKNLRRDINGGTNLMKTIDADIHDRDTSWSSMADELQETMANAVPIIGRKLFGETKAEKLYDAMVRGDTAYADRLRVEYLREYPMLSDLMANYEHVDKGFKFQHNGNTYKVVADSYTFGEDDTESKLYDQEIFVMVTNPATSALTELVKNRFMRREMTALEATNQLFTFGMEINDAMWRVDEWQYQLDTGSAEGYSKYKQWFDAIEAGEDLTPVVQKYLDGGVKEDTLRSQITSHFKPKYVEMTDEEREAFKPQLEAALLASGADRWDLEDIIMEWDFEAKYGDSYDNMIQAFKDGEFSREDMHNILLIRGYEAEDAEKKLNEWEFTAKYGFSYDEREDGYKDGLISAQDMRQALMTIGGKTPEEADQLMEAFEYLKAHPEVDVYASRVVYWQRDLEDLGYSIEDTGMNLETYLAEYDAVKDFTADKDENGNSIPYSKINKAFPYINSLNLTPEQKTALAVACGWAIKTVNKNKLW